MIWLSQGRGISGSLLWAGMSVVSGIVGTERGFRAIFFFKHGCLVKVQADDDHYM